jgi:hypothetical protein
MRLTGRMYMYGVHTVLDVIHLLEACFVKLAGETWEDA